MELSLFTSPLNESFSDIWWTIRKRPEAEANVIFHQATRRYDRELMIFYMPVSGDRMKRVREMKSVEGWQDAISKFVVLWAVIDPIGTVPVFISATAERTAEERKRIAFIASSVAAGILLFFIIVGEPVLMAMGVPILAFQIAGGIVLFLFALTMIFGESKPEDETEMLRSAQDTAVFPLATPSIASPGAMMAVVLLTENKSHTVLDQVGTAVIMLIVISMAFGLMRIAGTISRLIGTGGASIVSRVMGLILASIAATHVLEGAKEYFQQ